MENLKKYNQVFIESFGISESELNESLVYQSVDQWDSVGHMGMVAALEDEFEIMLEMDDIIDFGSYEIGKKILSKYGVEI